MIHPILHVLFCTLVSNCLQPFLRSPALALPWATLSPQLYEIQNSPPVDELFGREPTETSASHEQADGFSRRSVNRTKPWNVPILNDCNVQTTESPNDQVVKMAGMRQSRDERVGKYCQSGAVDDDKRGACVTPTRNSKYSMYRWLFLAPFGP